MGTNINNPSKSSIIAIQSTDTLSNSETTGTMTATVEKTLLTIATGCTVFGGTFTQSTTNYTNLKYVIDGVDKQLTVNQAVSVTKCCALPPAIALTSFVIKGTSPSSNNDYSVNLQWKA